MEEGTFCRNNCFLLVAVFLDILVNRNIFYSQEFNSKVSEYRN
jgi:hypothetical protein